MTNEIRHAELALRYAVQVFLDHASDIPARRIKSMADAFVNLERAIEKERKFYDKSNN